MTDTTTCPNCSATLPAGAAFCTSCGQRTAEATAAPADAAPSGAVAAPTGEAPDATRIDTPGLHDSTQVLPAAEPAAPPAAAPPAPSAPWEPAPAAPAPPSWGEAPAAPAWGEAAAPQPGPAAPADAPAWQAPAAAPPAWGQAPPTGQPQYGQPAPPGQWAPAPAATTSTTKAGSPLGGLATVAGAVLTLVGVFSGWVTLKRNDSGIASGTISMWSFASGDEVVKSNDPYLLVALAVAALAVGAVLFLGISRPIARIAAIVVGIGIIAVAALDWSSISSLVSDDAAFKAVGGGTGASAKTAIGFYLAIAGGVLTAAGALLPAKKAG